jgi:hypothetical protein
MNTSKRTNTVVAFRERGRQRATDDIIVATNYRIQGIACALGNLAREQMEPDLAAMILKDLGLTVAALKAAGADPFDLEPLTTHQ